MPGKTEIKTTHLNLDSITINNKEQMLLSSMTKKIIQT